MANLHVAGDGNPEMAPFVKVAQLPRLQVVARAVPAVSPWTYRLPKAYGSIPGYSLHSLPPNRFPMMERKGNILQDRKGN